MLALGSERERRIGCLPLWNMAVARPTPLFSIITVCFRAQKPLERTVASIQSQTFRDYEHLIIDGAGGEGTAGWLSTLQDPRITWVSEPDNGLYDAMNKGLRMARGTYVWFVNAGDLIEGPGVLAELAEQAAERPDILYGDVLLVAPDGEVLGTRSEVTTQRTPEHLNWTDLRLGMVVSHQAFLPRLAICPEYLSGNLCADIDWVIRCLKQSRKTVNTHLILARFETGGLSRQRHRQSLMDRYKVLEEHFGFWTNLWNHVRIGFRAVISGLAPHSRPRY